MLSLMCRLQVVLVATSVMAQDDYPVEFDCPEKNGFFPDKEQCDKYYECVGDVPETNFCPDGLLFEASDPNSELCDYPFNVDCGDREFVQEPEAGLNPKCYRANGFFNHDEENVCNKYYNCVHGFPHVYDCPSPLVFDEAQGTCVREEQASSFAKKCDNIKVKKNIDGFECPEGETLGANGQPLAHPTFRHPTSCRLYLICYNSKDLNEQGCPETQVYDHTINKCVLAEDGPDDCKCWYDCGADSNCPGKCDTNCECPA